MAVENLIHDCHILPPFSLLLQYYATFLLKTPLSTLQYASVNHTLYGKCVMLPQLNRAQGNKDGAKLSRKFALASEILTSKRL